MTTETKKTHKFQAAGLGSAPFVFVGLTRETFQASPESPVQPGACCDFCGTGISNVFAIKSADGKYSKVGCECIRKSGDSGLIRVVSDEESKKRRAKAMERSKNKAAIERDLIEAFKTGRCDGLKSMPHPKGRENETAHDYVAWCISWHCVGATVRSLIAKSL